MSTTFNITANTLRDTMDEYFDDNPSANVTNIINGLKSVGDSMNSDRLDLKTKSTSFRENEEIECQQEVTLFRNETWMIIQSGVKMLLNN